MKTIESRPLNKNGNRWKFIILDSERPNDGVPGSPYRYKTSEEAVEAGKQYLQTGKVPPAKAA